MVKIAYFSAFLLPLSIAQRFFETVIVQEKPSKQTVLVSSIIYTIDNVMNERRYLAILTDMKRMAERIKNSRRNKGLTQEELALKLNLHRSSVSAWEQGVNEPSVSNLEQLAILLDTAFEYLATGRGSSSIEDYLLKIASSKDKDNKILFITEEKREFLQQFDNLNPTIQKDIMKLIEDINKTEK